MLVKKLKTISQDPPKTVWEKRKESFLEFLEDKLIVTTNNFIHILRLNNIVYIKALGNYSKIYCAGKDVIVSSKTLKCFEDVLINKGFLRIHSNAIVNMSKIKGIEKNGVLSIVLEDGTKLPVSRAYKKALFSFLIK